VTYIREMIFGHDVDVPKPLLRARFVVMLGLTFIFAAWHYGAINYAETLVRPVVSGIWDMFCDLASAVQDFGQYLANRPQ
jgi:hypothetical protein